MAKHCDVLCDVQSQEGMAYAGRSGDAPVAGACETFLAVGFPDPLRQSTSAPVLENLPAFPGVGGLPFEVQRRMANERTLILTAEISPTSRMTLRTTATASINSYHFISTTPTLRACPV